MEEPLQETTDTSKYVNGISNESQDSDMFESGSAGIEDSLGSDVDINSRVEVGNTMIEGQDGVPKYTVKKTSSFKPVSVTKTFLMKAGSAAALPKSGMEKGALPPPLL